nr:uncharacterized protein LOC124222978 [Neodiprion pinetum]
MSSNDAKYPCIICQQLTNSITDLHNHQKHFHTSEELSMSVIHLVHYMCMERNLMMVKQIFDTSNYSTALQQYYANIGHNNCPAYEPNKNANIDAESRLNTAHHYTPLQLHFSEENSSIIVPNKWEIEFGKVEEISDESFVNSVNGICRDLRNIDREKKDCGKVERPKLTGSKIDRNKCRTRKISRRTAAAHKNNDKNHCKTVIWQKEKENCGFLQNVPTGESLRGNESSSVLGQTRLSNFEETFLCLP